MIGTRVETRGGGAFALSLLVHGAVIGGFAAFAAPRPGLLVIDAMPVALVMVPAPEEAPVLTAPPKAEFAQEPPPAPEPVKAEPAPVPPPPPPPVPDALPLPEPPPPPPVKAEVKQEPKPVPKPAPKPIVAKTPPKPVPAAPLAVAAPEVAAAMPGPTFAAPPTPPAPPAAPPPAPVPEIAAGPPVITEPRFRETPSKPIYPARAAAMEQQGEALVRVLIGIDGEQAEIQIWRSSGFDLLDRAALAAVRRWRFEPYRRDGIAQAAWVQVPVRFKLN